MKKRFLCLSLIFALTAAQIVPVAAAKKDEIQAEKANTESQLSATESREAELEEQKNALLSEINTLDKELVNVMAQIDILNNDIAAKETAIDKTKEDLAIAEAERDEQYAAMKKRIQYLYEKGGNDAWAQMLLEANSITDLLSKAEYTEKMYQYDRDELQKMKDVVQQVTDLGDQLAMEKAELEELKANKEEQQANLEVKLDEKKATASDYENQIAGVRSKADELRGLIEQQNAELQRIQEEERKAAEEAARKAEERRQQEAAAAAAAARQPAASTPDNANDTEDNGGGGGTPSAPESQPVDTPSNDEETSSGGGGGYSATGEAVVAYASQFIGNPYVYGGNSLTNGIDCSAFVQQVFAHFGYSLPRVSDAQAGSGRGISYSEARAGDIIVYPGHVAILAGDGGIVHASNSQPYPQGGIKYSPNALYRSYIAVRRIVD